MRFAFALYCGLALLVAACVGLVSLQQRNATVGRAYSTKGPDSILLLAGDDAAVRRMNAKSNVTRQLVDGQKTLLEAAAWFRYLNAATGQGWSEGSPGDENRSDGERICRRVIRWAVAGVELDPSDRRAALARRLEAELKEALARPGGIVLPAVE